MIINITVADRRATLEGTPTIVCNNTGYSIKFIFDGEWGANTVKTARFVWVAGGQLQQTDVIFTGDTVAVPLLSGTKEVKVGVFEGELQTTTPARIYCEQSIRCYGGEPAEETPGQYDHILTLYEQALEQQAAANSAANTARVAAQAATASQSKVEAIVAGNEAWTKDEADSRAAPAIVRCVSGAAVAVHDAADRPLQTLVLHGGATQAGTPTPDAPLELVPAVNAGPVNVVVYGKNMLQLNTGGQTTGVTETISNGMVSFDGTAEGSGGRTAWRRSNIVTLSPGTYHLSMVVPSGTAPNPCLTKAYRSEIVAGGGTFAITEPVDVYLGFNYQAGVTYNAKNVKVQLERGNVATDYEEYKEPQALAIDAPAMYAGSLDVLTGRALYAGISEPQASGWNTGRSASGWAHGYDSIGKDTIPMHFHLGGEKADYFPATLCSHFPAAASWADIVDGITEMAYRGNSGGGLAYVAVRIKRSRLAEYGFVDDGTGETAPAAFQAWLEAQAAAGAPVQFVGEIDNTAELGVKSAQSYKLTTTVVNDAGATMSVGYVADTAAYIKNNNPGPSNSVLLTDRETGTVYELHVYGGKLTMTAVD